MKSREDFLIETLKEIGCSISNRGFEYTKSAVLFVLKDKNVLNKITKYLYPEVAKLYINWGATASKIERSIRYTKDCVFSQPNIEYLKIFKGQASRRTGKVSNSVFIACIADYVERNYESECNKNI